MENTQKISELEAFYPEIYEDLLPYITEAVNEVLHRGYNLTPEGLNAIVDNIIKRSGLWDEDEENDADYAIALRHNMRPSRRRPRRRHHNRHSLRDIAKIIFLRDYFNRCTRCR